MRFLLALPRPLGLLAMLLLAAPTGLAQGLTAPAVLHGSEAGPPPCFLKRIHQGL